MENLIFSINTVLPMFVVMLVGLPFFAIGSTIVSFVLIWYFSDKCFKDKRMVSSFVQGAFRGSFSILALAHLLYV